MELDEPTKAAIRFRYRNSPEGTDLFLCVPSACPGARKSTCVCGWVTKDAAKRGICKEPEYGATYLPRIEAYAMAGGRVSKKALMKMKTKW